MNDRATAVASDHVDVEAVDASTLRPPSAVVCAFPFCAQLLAGVSIWDANYGCTAGFYVGYYGDTRPYMLTAGHCISSSGALWSWSTCSVGPSNCAPVGSQVTGYNGGTSVDTADGDAGLIRSDIIEWQAYPGYMNWSSGGISTLHWYETANPSPGQWVCKNGVTTQTTCGWVTTSYVNISPDAVGRYYTGLFETNACSQQGDSGGPFTRADSETAVGLVSHGNYAGSCSPFPGIGEPVSRARSRFGVEIWGG